MPVRQYANAPATTLAVSCTSGATSITVTAVTGLPISYPYTLILDRGTATEEAVSVTAAAGTVLTVSRGIDSTTAFAHIQGATVEHGITAQDIREPNAHINASSGVHGVTGSVVGTTDTQTLTNKDLSNCTGTTQATSDNDTSLATTAFVKAAILATHPVGSIFVHTVNTNPGTFLGGTWTAWGSGRVPVGVDGTAEFPSPEATGGTKTVTLTTNEIPGHAHTGTTGTESTNHQHYSADGNGIVQGGFAGISANVTIGGGSYVGGPTGNQTVLHTHNFTTSTVGSGGAHNNLQPYITCYMFKRTA